MLRVSFDVFSGRPNPAWDVDEQEARDLLRDLQRSPEAIAPLEAAPAVLGYRGVTVEVTEAAEGVRAAADFGQGLPAAFRLGSGTAPDSGRSLEFADRLLERLGTPAAARGAAADEYPGLDLRELVRESLGGAEAALRDVPTDLDVQLWSRNLPREMPEADDEGVAGTRGIEPAEEEAGPPDEGAERELRAAAACWNPAPVKGTDQTTLFTQAVGACQVDLTPFNPNFWNVATVRPFNNCYNYGTNRRTDTFAQPGRATCAQATTMACANVTAGAKSDGARTVPNCAPLIERPRWYMALVIWPGRDYHWYRKASNGFWGHKPGSTAAKNTDNSGNVIFNPQTCNRGPYTIFCGYWFSRRPQIIR
jgi:hypothetical protein